MTVPERRFLLLHGYKNHRPVGHWQWWLAEELRRRGEQVLYPQLPDADHAEPQAWLDALAAEYMQMGHQERIVICHSLGCTLWHLAAELEVLPQPADRVLWVAPAGPGVLAQPELAPFVPPTWRSAVLARSARTRIRLVASDNDPVCPEGPAADLYGPRLQLDAETVKGAGHFTTGDGYGPWPAVLAWCLDPVRASRRRPRSRLGSAAGMGSGHRPLPGPRGPKLLAFARQLHWGLYVASR